MPVVAACLLLVARSCGTDDCGGAIGCLGAPGLDAQAVASPSGGASALARGCACARAAAAAKKQEDNDRSN